MPSPSRRRRPRAPPSSSPSTRPLSPLLVLVAAAATLPLSFAAASSYPQVDFEKLGHVALGGSFAGLSFFDSSLFGESSSGSGASNITLSDSRATVFRSSSNGAEPIALAQTNAGGSVSAVCVLEGSEGSSNGTLFVGGSFTSLSDMSASNIASVNLDTLSVSALASGVDGAVSALYCNSSSGEVWVGGAFSSSANDSSSAGGRVAVWSPSAGSFSPPPFDGFTSGAVDNISPSADNSSLVFAGSFSTAFTSSATSINGSTSPTGLPIPNTIIYSSGSTPFTASLTPITYSPSTRITASPSSSLSGFSDPSVLLCPAGADGPNNSWLAGDAQNAQLTVDLSAGALSATGLRIGNSLADGRGTTSFSAVSIPDDTRLTLSYVDPATGTNRTCDDACPLSTNASVPFQDFLFDGGARSLSGFQVTLLGWQGAGAGLHILQLLSAGSYAPLPADQSNSTTCASLPQTGTTQTNGSWTSISPASSIGGVTSSALIATTLVSSFDASSVPSLDYYPYVTGTGNYSVTLVVPGCTVVDDCSSRTSLAASVTPYAGAGAFAQTIAPSRFERAYVLYTGAVQATSEAFSPVVHVAMSTTPTGVNGDSYTVVVGRVELALLTVDTTGTGEGTFTQGDAHGLGGGYSNGTRSGPTSGLSGAGRGFGLFEYTPGGSTTVTATRTIGNDSVTELDRVAQALSTSIGTSGSEVAGAVQVGETWFVGGKFSSSAGWANIVRSSGLGNSTSLAPLAGQGLNGAVHALVATSNGTLYAGGDFTSTQDGQTALVHVATYDSSASAWSALGGGVSGGAVSSLALSADGRSLLVGGAFTAVSNSSSSSTGSRAGGFAVWDLVTGGWLSSQGVAYGEVDIVAPSSSEGQAFFAGQVTGVAGQAADGFALLTTGGNGTPSIQNIPLGIASTSLSPSPSTGAANVVRRAVQHAGNHSAPPSAFSSRQWLTSSVVGLKRLALPPRSDPSLPRALSLAAATSFAAQVGAPSVQAAAFWRNGSSEHDVVIAAGNFTSSDSSSGSGARNVVVYDLGSNTVSALQNAQVQGVVRALEVVDDTLFVGGESGLRAYNLKKEAWMDGQVPALNASSGSATVNAVLRREGTSDVLVAGAFASAGALSCGPICSWSTSSSSWSALSASFTGEVTALAFAGDKADILLAAGDFALADGTQTHVARYSYSNASWATIEGGQSVPGPATALVVDERDASNVFLAGTSSSSGDAYLLRWDGASWSDVSTSSTGSSLALGSSAINQLSIVPLSATHSGGNTAVVQSNRALLASGALSLGQYGAYSAAMFDGAQWFPYVRSTREDGSAGSVRGLFASQRSFSFDIRKFLARGVVVVICMAIALGVVFLAALIGLLLALWRRHHRSSAAAHPSAMYSAYGKPDSAYGAGSYSDEDFTSAGPQDPHRAAMLDNINAATEGVITGAVAGGGAAALAAHERHSSRGLSEDGAYGAAGSDESEEVEARVAHARWSLTPDPGTERELPLKAGKPYLILNSQDESWWLALDPETGEQGAVPAAWML